MSVELQELLERLAEIHHNQWRTWAAGVGTLVPKERQEAWGKLFVPYAKLPEEVKNERRGIAQLQLEAAQQVFGDIDGRAQKLYETVMRLTSTIEWVSNVEGMLPFERAGLQLEAVSMKVDRMEKEIERMKGTEALLSPVVGAAVRWYGRLLTNRNQCMELEDELNVAIDVYMQHLAALREAEAKRRALVLPPAPIRIRPEAEL